MAKVLKRCRTALCIAGILSCTVISAGAVLGAGRLQSYCEEDRWQAYIPYIKEEHAPVSVQFANTAVLDTQTIAVSETQGACIHTVLLFDNSFSISEQNRPLMKQAAADIIRSCSDGELFTIASFDDHLHILARESNDISYLSETVENIEYASQPTFLKEALYTAYTVFGTEDGSYKRFVVLSDGSDDDPVGYTCDEIIEMYSGRNYPVYAVGSVFQEDTQALEKLFSISRATGGAYFLLDEMEDISDISARIKADAPKLLVRVSVPFEAQDGGSKEIKISVQEGEITADFFTGTKMPFAKIPAETAPDPEEYPEQESADEYAEYGYPAQDIPEEPEEITIREDVSAQEMQTLIEAKAETGVSEEPEPWPQEEAEAQTSFMDDDSLITGIKNSYLCAGMAAALGIMITVLLFRKRSEKDGGAPPEDLPEDYGMEKEDDLCEKDDDATVSLRTYPGPSVVKWDEARQDS